MIIPNWALRKAGPEDKALAEQAFKDARANLKLTDRTGMKTWMKSRGEKISWLRPSASFYKQLLASEESFREVLAIGVMEIWIPKYSYTVPEDFLATVDQLYAEKDWNTAVEYLREIRRAIDLGVKVQIEDKTFTSASTFYNWAHQRYHVLEEAADKWILDDR